MKIKLEQNLNLLLLQNAKEDKNILTKKKIYIIQHKYFLEFILIYC
jgi:hypothetical protein